MRILFLAFLFLCFDDAWAEEPMCCPNTKIHHYLEREDGGTEIACVIERAGISIRHGNSFVYSHIRGEPPVEKNIYRNGKLFRKDSSMSDCSADFDKKNVIEPTLLKVNQYPNKSIRQNKFTTEFGTRFLIGNTLWNINKEGRVFSKKLSDSEKIQAEQYNVEDPKCIPKNEEAKKQISEILSLPEVANREFNISTACPKMRPEYRLVLEREMYFENEVHELSLKMEKCHCVAEELLVSKILANLRVERLSYAFCFQSMHKDKKMIVAKNSEVWRYSFFQITFIDLFKAEIESEYPLYAKTRELERKLSSFISRVGNESLVGVCHIKGSEALEADKSKYNKIKSYDHSIKSYLK